ncbi:hypothetical protein [Mycolicibacter virginiensis]|nr:hypothetical protein [Mycolicibacter virginiensis]
MTDLDSDPDRDHALQEAIRAKHPVVVDLTTMQAFAIGEYAARNHNK